MILGPKRNAARMRSAENIQGGEFGGGTKEDGKKDSRFSKGLISRGDSPVVLMSKVGGTE